MEDATDIDALRRLVHDQARRIEALERMVGSTPPTTRRAATPAAGAPTASSDRQITDRRRLLATAGLAATATAAAGIMRAAPADAATGDPLKLGFTNQADVGTGILLTGTNPSGTALFSAADTPLAPAGGDAAVWGWAAQTVHVGVRGTSTRSGGTGVVAAGPSNGAGLSASGGRAALRLDGTGAAPPNRSDAHTRGEIDIDAAGDAWLCVTSGSPGAWRKLGGPTTAGAFHVLATTNRIYDSRPGYDPADVTKGILSSFQERVIDAKHGSAVPAGATAALVNLTATGTNTAGYLALFKNGISYPGNSSINWAASGVTIANLAVVALDTNGLFKVRCDGGGVTHFVIDVIGYFR